MCLCFSMRRQLWDICLKMLMLYSACWMQGWIKLPKQTNHHYTIQSSTKLWVLKVVSFIDCKCFKRPNYQDNLSKMMNSTEKKPLNSLNYMLQIMECQILDSCLLSNKIDVGLMHGLAYICHPLINSLLENLLRTQNESSASSFPLLLVFSFFSIFQPRRAPIIL